MSRRNKFNHRSESSSSTGRSSNVASSTSSSERSRRHPHHKRRVRRHKRFRHELAIADHPTSSSSISVRSQPSQAESPLQPPPSPPPVELQKQIVDSRPDSCSIPMGASGALLAAHHHHCRVSPGKHCAGGSLQKTSSLPVIVVGPHQTSDESMRCDCRGCNFLSNWCCLPCILIMLLVFVIIWIWLRNSQPDISFDY